MMLASVEMVGQSGVAITFPVAASRNTGRRRRGSVASEASRFERLGFPSRVTNVATIVWLSVNHSEVRGLSLGLDTHYQGNLPKSEHSQ